MAAGVHNIEITKGTDFSLTMTLKDAGGAALNVTNYTFKSQLGCLMVNYYMIW